MAFLDDVSRRVPELQLDVHCNDDVRIGVGAFIKFGGLPLEARHLQLALFFLLLGCGALVYVR